MPFSFGTPSSAPPNTGLSSGFSFGANKPATPGFGLTATSQPSTGLFGANTSTSTPAFGATSTPAFGAAAAPAFGATSTPAFGATTSTAPAFGSTAFGTTSTPAFGAATSAPAFGTTTSAPAFGAANTSGFGTGLGFGTTSAPSTGLSFGTTTTASTGLSGFSFSGAPTSQAGFGLLGANTTTTSSGLFGASLGTSIVSSQPAATVAPSLGLGGSSNAAGIGVTNTTSSDGKNEPPKQTKLPNEISTTVDSFKEFVKKQKQLSSDIMRVSVKPFHKVASEAEQLSRAVCVLQAEVGKVRAHCRRLRSQGLAALTALESQQRYVSDFDGLPAPCYIKDLLSEWEQQLNTIRRQMDVADKQMLASPKLLTEQELTMGIRRMHESLVALAGRLQAVHVQVEAQKEQFLNLRKNILKDNTNVFETQDTTTSLDEILRESENVKKKSKLGIPNTMGSAVLSDPRAALGNIYQLAGPSPFAFIGTNMTPFSSGDNSGSNWQAPQSNVNTSLNTSGFGTFGSTETSGFQLQKPPGKRTKQ